MQTTSFQGVSPQFAGTKPSPQGNVRRIPASLPAQAKDSVRFGGPSETKEAQKTEESKEAKETEKEKAAEKTETTETPASSKRSFWKKSKDATKEGFKQVFQWKSMAKDVGIGALVSLVLFIFPPHIHGLIGIPMVMSLNGMIRFAKGAYDGFKGQAAS